jgi:hypothetical protein
MRRILVAAILGAASALAHAESFNFWLVDDASQSVVGTGGAFPLPSGSDLPSLPGDQYPAASSYISFNGALESYLLRETSLHVFDNQPVDLSGYGIGIFDQWGTWPGARLEIQSFNVLLNRFTYNDTITRWVDGGAVSTIRSFSGYLTFTQPVPEPGTWALFLVGLGVVVGANRIRRPAV